MFNQPNINTEYMGQAMTMIPNTLLSTLGPVGPLVDIGATTIGQPVKALDTVKEKQRRLEQLNDRSDKLALVPYMAKRQLVSRRLAITDKPTVAYSQILGDKVFTVLAGLLGGIVAYRKGLRPWGVVGVGALTSAIAGMAANGAGVGIAGLTKRRTKQEQKDYEKSPWSSAMNYMVPGMAAYNFYKGLGVSRDYEPK